MEQFEVIQLTVSGSYSLGIYYAKDGNSALRKSIKNLKPTRKDEYIDFLIYVGHVQKIRG